MAVDTEKLEEIIGQRSSKSIVAEGIGVDRSTFYRKLKSGESFSIGQAQKLAEVIPLTSEEAIEIFFGNKVAKMRLENDEIHKEQEVG